jgi:uncharacterized FlaG/YvyC family protein
MLFNVSFAKGKETITELNTRKVKKEKVKMVNKLLKKLLQKERERMNLLNAPLQTALNFSILSVLNNMIQKNYSSI